MLKLRQADRRRRKKRFVRKIPKIKGTYGRMTGKQGVITDFLIGNNSADPSYEPIYQYVKPLPRASPIIHREPRGPAVDVDDGKAKIKRFKITIRGEP